MRRSRALVPIVAGLLSLSSSAAHAQGPTLARATEQLRSRDAAQLVEAIQALGMLGSPRAIDPLAARIREGLPPEALDAALDTLLVLGRPEAGPILFELASHRRADVRLRAVQAIAATRARGADRALVTALADLDPSVRAAAATGLGELGAVSAIDTLFLAFDRGVVEAGPALGRLARPEHVARLLEQVGRIPFGQLQVVLDALLSRRDLPVRARLDVIARLGELATPEVRSFLDEWVRALPGDVPASDPVRRAAEDVIARIAA